MKRLDETDLKRRMLFTGSGYAYACDNGLGEHETADLLNGRRERMAQQQRRATQVEFDLLIGGFLLPAHTVEADEIYGWVRVGVEQVGPEPDVDPLSASAAHTRMDFAQLDDFSG